ncbi:MAG TPA: hypothetical protein VF549_11490 [Solirubrobacteraceae bacterium]
MAARRFVPPLATAALLAAGCGGDPPAPPSPPAKLTHEERQLVRVYEGRIETHCIRVARSVVDPRKAPTPRQEERAFAAADAFAALATRKPKAPIDVGQDLRLYLSDVVENLEGSNCDPRMVARLERALDAIPNE